MATAPELVGFGEGSAAVRPLNQHSFIKRIPSEALSHYESEDELLDLVYTPCINRKRAPARPPRAARHPRQH